MYKTGYGSQQNFVLRRANGTEAAPTKILSGEYIGSIYVNTWYDNGAGTTGWNGGSPIRFYATEDRNSSTNGGMRTVFLSIPNGSSTASTRGIITEAGSWLIGAVGSTTNEISLASIGTFPRIQMLGTSNAGQSAILQARFDATAGDAPQHILAKSRGTALDSFTAVANNDLLAVWAGEGADGTQFVRAGSIRCYADGTVSTGVVPGRLEFYTHNSSGTATKAVTIDSSQKVIVGTDPGGSELLRVGGAAVINGSLSNNGAVYVKVRTIVSSGGSTTLDSTDYKVSVTGTGIHTVVLPACSTGRVIIIKNRSTQTVTINTGSGDIFNDIGTSVPLGGSGTWLELIGNGTSWESMS
jgi:hypothetical protein